MLGSPELDAHKARNSISLNEVLDYYDIKWDNYGIFIFHSVTSELESLKKEIQFCCNALKKTKKNFVVISPNNDPGCEIIFKTIGKLPKSHFKQIPSMRFAYFSIAEESKIPGRSLLSKINGLSKDPVAVTTFFALILSNL